MQTVLDAVLKAGEKYGLRRGGNTTYFSTITESGWMGSPFPAIFTSEKLRPYREWLPGDTWESGSQLGGSFVSKKLEDYYVTPFDLGVEGRIKFDHDFVGRAALEKMVQNPRRTRRTLVWNKDDVLKIFESMLTPGPSYKLIRLPYSAYAYQQNDAVRTPDGKLVGRATFSGYSANENLMLSMVMIDLDHAEPGTELVLTWGEPNGGSRKKNVEKHEQTTVRVTVGPAPYSEFVRNKKYERIFKRQ